MKIEHIAINVSEPGAFANWYVENLGLRIVRADPGPTQVRFLADDDDETIIEVYNNPLGEIISYQEKHPMTLHIAFSVTDLQAARQALVSAGGTQFGEITTSPTGDQLAIVRDPWGIAIQLVKRNEPLV